MNDCLNELLEFLGIDMGSLSNSASLDDYIQQKINEHVNKYYEGDHDFFISRIHDDGKDIRPIEGLTSELLDKYMKNFPLFY